MRMALGALVFASAVPAGGMRACVQNEHDATKTRLDLWVVSPGECQYPLSTPELDDVRVGCFPTAEAAGDADPLGDTVLLTAGTVSFDAPCTLFAFRQDGALWTRSLGERYSPGEPLIAMSFPRGDTGGVGISFVQDPWRHEVIVRSVQEGTPAVGSLVPGDRILSVDGQPIHGGRWAFVGAATGAPGSTVAFSVLHADGTVTDVALERRHIP